MLEAFAVGVNAFMTFLGFSMMFFVGLAIVSAIVLLLGAHKTDEPEEE